MLEILLIIWIGRIFSKYAKKNNLNSALWTTLGVLSYIFGEIIGTVILVFTNPGGIDSLGLVYAYGLPLAALLTFVTYSLMKSAAKNAEPQTDDEILDKDMLD